MPRPTNSEDRPVLVTGAAGFIGSAVTLRLLTSGRRVVAVDALTYAASEASLREAEGSPAFVFHRVDIRDADALDAVFTEAGPSAVMHLAAESHVDRSIDGPGVFIETNVGGTFNLLQAARRHRDSLPAGEAEAFRFHHVSTDEVYGSLELGGEEAFHENTPYDPSSPYAASKAASDHLVTAWHRTYGLPVVISNTCNNYGPRQFPEKLIPHVILSALEGRPLPVYGDGANVRDWLYVEDHAVALATVLDSGRPGRTYAIGARAERSNLEVVRSICGLLDEMAPRSDGSAHADAITFVEDRPGHDRRYAIDPTRVEEELGWRARESFESGLRKTVEWYLENRWWWEPLRERRYDGARLGLGSAS